MTRCSSFLPPAVMVLPTPAACRFLSAGEFVHAALAAYYAACQRLRPPDGEPWLLNGYPWSSPEDFQGHLLQEVEERLWQTAVARGYAIEETWTDSGEADAVGAAHGDALVPANPLLLGPERQELPAQESVMHDQPNRSAVR